jgi:predicted membrane channel-forming protein YqfA (hemolysin III family)
LFSNLPCSIGFSGILFGIMAWELTTKKDFDIFIVLSIVGIVVAPSIQDSKTSLVGHAVGAIAGVIGGILWKSIEKKIK